MANANGSQSFLPSTDTGLLDWAANFGLKITATPAVFGLTPAQATAFEAFRLSYANLLAKVLDPAQRTQVIVSQKDEAKRALRNNASELSKIIQGQATVTDAMKIDLRLNVRKSPTPIPVPDEMPEMDILSVTGRTVKARLHSATIEHRRKPNGVSGANLWTFVGETPPEELSGWLFQGTTTRTLFEIEFPVTVEQGSKVWLAAAWFNPRGQTGPVSDPVSTFIQYGGVTLTNTQNLKKAA